MSQENPYHREVVEFFHFLQEWLNGRVPNSDEAFSRIIKVTAEGSQYIDYKGEIRSLRANMNGFRPAYGGVPGFQVRIDNFHVQWEENEFALVTYEQHLQWADGNARVHTGTALLHKNPEMPDGIEWLHIHHTAQVVSDTL